MGEFSILDTASTCTDIFLVNILTIARRVEPEAATPEKIVSSEFARQIVSLSRRNSPNALPVSPLSFKEIEMISIFSMSQTRTRLIILKKPVLQ